MTWLADQKQLPSGGVPVQYKRRPAPNLRLHGARQRASAMLSQSPRRCCPAAVSLGMAPDSLPLSSMAEAAGCGPDTPCVRNVQGHHLPSPSIGPCCDPSPPCPPSYQPVPCASLRGMPSSRAWRGCLASVYTTACMRGDTYPEPLKNEHCVLDLRACGGVACTCDAAGDRWSAVRGRARGCVYAVR